MELTFLSPDQCFFTDPALLMSQAASDAFGPLSATEFRLDSHHTSSGTAPAYAICRGTVFLQESTGGRVNLVLKPLAQGRQRFPAVAYFIYKGIDKSSLIAGDNITIASRTLNDLTSALWDHQDQLNAEILETTGVDPGTDPPREALTRGLDTEPGSTPLLSAFVNGSSDYQLPMVSTGDHLGDFDPTGFGLCIVLERPSHSPTLEDARTHSHTLTVAALTGTETAAQIRDHWHEKDQILAFADPAAYWGSCYRSRLKVWDGAKFESRKGTALYTDVLSTFVHKNKVYLDLRNAQGNWLNHAGDKSDSIKWGLGEEPGTWTDATLTTSGWPLFSLDKSDFTGEGCSDDYQTLQLKLPLGNVTDAFLHLRAGWIPDRFPKDARLSEAFLRTNPDDSPSEAISLAVPLYNDSGTTDTPIACWTSLRMGRSLFGTDPDTAAGDSQLTPAHHLDFLFAPFQLADSLPGVRQLESRIFYDGRYVDDALGRHQDYTAAIGIAKGLDSVSLFAFPLEKNHSPEQAADPMLPVFEVFTDDTAEFKTAFAQQSPHLWNTTRTFSEEDGTVHKQAQIGRRTFSHRGFTTEPDFGDMTLITFKLSEFQSLETLAGSSGFAAGYPVYLCFPEHDRTELDDDYQLVRHEVQLCGYVETGGEHITTYIDSGIYLSSYGRL